MRSFQPPYLYSAAQVPSLDTMQAPTGSSGVQALPKSGHWRGSDLPLEDLAAEAATLLAGLLHVHRQAPRGVEAGEPGRIARPESGMTPIPRQRASQGSKTRVEDLLCLAVSFCADDPAVLDLHLGLSGQYLAGKHRHPLQHVEGFEAGDDAGDVVVAGQGLVRRRRR